MSKPRLILVLLLFAAFLHAQSPTAAMPEKIIIDTDIGDDIDDAFAVALALRCPELQILGISSAFGDTATRAKLLDRFLAEDGHPEIPVAVGLPSNTKNRFTQRSYAEASQIQRSHPQAVDFILDKIRHYPRQITLVAIGPLTNIGAVMDKDPETFRKLRRVVLMGGSIARRYGDMENSPPRGPEPEWNIVNDISAAKKLFASGVPVYMMPLDSTQLKLNSANRTALFQMKTPLTDALEQLYHQWGQETPTLFDVMTIAYILDPTICPVTPMRIRVDDQGFTRVDSGAPNANVCLNSNSESFFRFYMRRMLAPQ